MLLLEFICISINEIDRPVIGSSKYTFAGFAMHTQYLCLAIPRIPILANAVALQDVELNSATDIDSESNYYRAMSEQFHPPLAANTNNDPAQRKRVRTGSISGRLR